MKAKRILSITIAAIMLFGTIGAQALDINTFSEELSVYYNGVDVYANSEEKPIIINDRTMVPLRPIFEAMGWEDETITYDDSTKTAHFQGGDTSCSFTNESATAIRYWSDGNTKEYTLDVPATIYNDKFYIPLRAFCEIWDQDIEWINETRSVYVGDTVENVVGDVTDPAETYSYSEYTGIWYYVGYTSDWTEDDIKEMELKAIDEDEFEIVMADGTSERMKMVSDKRADSVNTSVSGDGSGRETRTIIEFYGTDSIYMRAVFVDNDGPASQGCGAERTKDYFIEAAVDRENNLMSAEEALAVAQSDFDGLAVMENGSFTHNGKLYYQFVIRGFIEDHYTVLTHYVVAADGSEAFEGTYKDGEIENWEAESEYMGEE